MPPLCSLVSYFVGKYRFEQRRTVTVLHLTQIIPDQCQCDYQRETHDSQTQDGGIFLRHNLPLKSKEATICIAMYIRLPRWLMD
ncbi:hypothetical protein Sbal223_4422 (plasmid) [Shewanella baltica OS223]|nr:hypothetical protein Sbal223_4422 [Shewanella baltica OS223]